MDIGGILSRNQEKDGTLVHEAEDLFFSIQVKDILAVRPFMGANRSTTQAEGQKIIIKIRRLQNCRFNGLKFHNPPKPDIKHQPSTWTRFFNINPEISSFSVRY